MLEKIVETGLGTFGIGFPNKNGGACFHHRLSISTALNSTLLHHVVSIYQKHNVCTHVLAKGHCCAPRHGFARAILY